MLNARRRKFCIKYAQCGNSKEALKYAGYKGNDYNQSCKILKDSECKAFIQECVEEVNSENKSRVKISRERVIDKLLGIADKEESKDGDKIKALDTISRIMGYYAPTEINQNVNVSTDLQRARQRLIKYVGSNEAEGMYELEAGYESDNSMVSE